MRMHRAELALFVFLALLGVGASILAYSLFGVSVQSTLDAQTAVNHLVGYRTSMTMALAIFGTSLLFGILFIYPIIRSQVREETQLREMTDNLSKRSQTLEQAALTDGLTGMHNRRYFDDALKEYLGEFSRIDRPIGLMVLDLDHFKSINDTHGHDVGDEVLRAVSECLREFTRFHDVVARLGGEEFAIVAPNMDINDLFKFADRIRYAVSNLSINAGNVVVRVTTSIGIAVWNRKESGDELYKRADKQLYDAKRQGRNRVCS